MRFLLFHILVSLAAALPASQVPLLRHASTNRTVSPDLFRDLEELARIVDISYCVGLTGLGISKPFKCLSRCSEFPSFELVATWNTGQLMSDSCGYIALSHDTSNPRIIVAFRGTYSIANTVIDLSTIPQEYVPYPSDPEEASIGPKCNNCTVHSGFFSSWRITAPNIIPHVEAALAVHPEYKVSLVGHSLGGAVAALAGLDFVSRGWDPTVTTFGEPRIGNAALMQYLDAQFGLAASDPLETKQLQQDIDIRYRRVTHVSDPVPLLPLTEWSYRMHAGEIYITKAALSPEIVDVRHCFGDEDDTCIAGEDSSLANNSSTMSQSRLIARGLGDDLLETVREAELVSRAGGPWTVPTRYKLWQLFFAHRDYFWRLGLCVPGGDPWHWNLS